MPQAHAITWGEPDLGHPYVGAILVQWRGQWLQFCSGTLIASRVFLTAGHCTDALRSLEIPASDLRVSFWQLLFSIASEWLPIETYETHPDYRWGPTADPHDVGVVILRDPAAHVGLGRLAPVGFLDGLAADRGLRGARFVNVGYGADEERFTMNERRVSESSFLALLPAWLVTSQVGRRGHGGTCIGDSGGPALYRDAAGVETVVALTSWGDAVCKATNVGYRIDTPGSRAYVDGVLARFA